MPVSFSWCTSESVESGPRITSVKCFISAMVVSHCFFQQWSPDGTIFTNPCVHALIWKEFKIWKSIINGHLDWHHECIQIKCIDASPVDASCGVFFVIDEDVFDSSWYFSHGCCGGHDPAVSELSLIDIVRGNSIGAKE